MSQALDTLIPPRDHNKPPELLPVPTITAAVKEEHFDLLKRIDDVIAKLKAVPAKIEDDETQNHVADLLKAARVARTTAEAVRKIEIEPYETRKKAIHALFKKPSDEISKLEETVRDALTAYTTEQADKARIEAERKAEEARQEEERLKREAAEAERKRAEAERLRVEEEKRAAEAAQKRKEAEEEARRQKEVAEKAKVEAARLEKEQKERAAKEAEEAEQRRIEDEARRAEQLERDRLDEIRRQRENEERQAEQERRNAAEQAEIARLKKQREEAEAEAKKSRAQAAAALEERRAAEQNVRDAKTEEREAKTDSKSAASQADRTAKVASKQERIAGGSSSNLARGRSDLGTVSTLSGRWTVAVTDYDALPIEVLRPFIAKDALDAAAYRYMQTLNETQKNSNDTPGIHFEFTEEARVL